MGRENKISIELKLKAVKEYLDGEGSTYTISSKYGVSQSSFRGWLGKYKSTGSDGFNLKHNNSYTEEFKSKVVKSYLSGEGSYPELAVKYKIPSHGTVNKWVSLYNNHERLDDYKIGGSPIMAKRRKTTYEERIEIVKHCIESNYNYAETSQKHQVSYQQVYSWISKFNEGGVEALQDKRGKKRSKDEMSELEKLRAQNKLLEAENKRKQMEIDFLKKLEEIERRRY
jgi:transposase-like protein